MVWRKPKSHTPYSLDTDYRSFKCCLTPYYGYPTDTSYPLGGKHTTPFSTLLTGLGSCEYELSKYTFFVRMYGYVFHRGDDYNTVYQSTGWGNFTEIEYDENTDPCNEDALSNSLFNDYLRVDIDRSNVGLPVPGYDWVPPPPSPAPPPSPPLPAPPPSPPLPAPPPYNTCNRCYNTGGTGGYVAYESNGNFGYCNSWSGPNLIYQAFSNKMHVGTPCHDPRWNIFVCFCPVEYYYTSPTCSSCEQSRK
jgi:hypothetical protein